MKSVTRRLLSVMLCAVLLAGSIGISAQAYNSYDHIDEGDRIVITVDELNVRSGPGLQYAKVGIVTRNYVPVVREISGNWGLIDSGWICLDYARPRSGNGSTGNSTASPGSFGSSSYYGRTAYVTADLLNVRSGPGLEYAVKGQITGNTKVSITETRKGWGLVDGGWICLDYVNYTSPTIDYTNCYVFVTADRLNIRQGPGTGYSRTGSLTYGTTIEVLEFRGNWGRTNRGWICLEYTYRV